jgi:hypothetical protein
MPTIYDHGFARTTRARTTATRRLEAWIQTVLRTNQLPERTYAIKNGGDTEFETYQPDYAGLRGGVFQVVEYFNAGVLITVAAEEDRVWPEIMILCTLPPTGLKVRVERGLSGDMLAVPAPVALFLSALVARVKRGQPQW